LRESHFADVSSITLVVGPEGGLSWLLAGCALVCIGFSCGFGVAMGEALDVLPQQLEVWGVVVNSPP